MRPLLRGLVITAVAVAVVVLLFTVVFPWFDRTFVDDPTLTAPTLVGPW